MHANVVTSRSPSHPGWHMTSLTACRLPGPVAAVEVVTPFEETHDGKNAMTVRDPDGRIVAGGAGVIRVPERARVAVSLRARKWLVRVAAGVTRVTL